MGPPQAAGSTIEHQTVHQQTAAAETVDLALSLHPAACLTPPVGKWVPCSGAWLPLRRHRNCTPEVCRRAEQAPKACTQHMPSQPRSSCQSWPAGESERNLWCLSQMCHMPFSRMPGALPAQLLPSSQERPCTPTQVLSSARHNAVSHGSTRESFNRVTDGGSATSSACGETSGLRGQSLTRPDAAV